MRSSTKLNLLATILWLVFAIFGLVGIVLGNWMHIATLSMSSLLAYTFYTDDMYGVESVKEYFARKRKEKK